MVLQDWVAEIDINIWRELLLKYFDVWWRRHYHDICQGMTKDEIDLVEIGGKQAKQALADEYLTRDNIAEGPSGSFPGKIPWEIVRLLSGTKSMHLGNGFYTRLPKFPCAFPDTTRLLYELSAHPLCLTRLWFTFPNLRQLHIATNFGQSLPRELDGSPLEELHFRGDLRGTVHSLNLPNLRLMKLWCCRLASLPFWISTLPKLVHLDLSNNDLDEKGLARGTTAGKCTTCFPALRALILDHNRLEVLPDLRRLPVLEIVSLFGNPLRKLSEMPTSLRTVNVAKPYLHL